MSKNNPEKRGKETALRTHKGKKVIPVMFIDRSNRRKYIAAQYESGDLAMDSKGIPLPYKNI